jgi:hypothetical protein
MNNMLGFCDNDSQIHSAQIKIESIKTQPQESIIEDKLYRQLFCKEA